MPTVITGAVPAAVINTLSGPADTETMDAADVNTPFQTLLNNDAYLSSLTQVTGVRLIRSAVNVAACSALTGMVDGELCLVGIASQTKLYRFLLASAAVANGDELLTGVGGRWFHVRPPGSTRVMNHSIGGTVAADVPSTASYVAVGTTLSVTGPIISGDRVVCTATVQMNFVAVGTGAYVRLVFDYGDGTLVTANGSETQTTIGASGYYTTTLTASLTTTQSNVGTAFWKLEGKAASAFGIDQCAWHTETYCA